MNRRPSRWHIGAVALALLVVAVATGAAVGHSAATQTSASDTLVDGTTDTITNLDPAGTYDFGTFTLDANVFEHLLDFKNGAKLEPSLATKCFSVGTLKTWRCNLRHGVKFHDGSAFDSADVKFSIDRVNNKAVKAQAAANSPSPLLGNLAERHDKRPVRRDVPSQVAAGDVAVGARDAVLLHRPERHVFGHDKLRSNT